MMLYTKSRKLDRLIEALNSQKNWSNSKLIELLKELSIIEEDLVAYQRYQHPVEESYGRNEIYSNEYFRVYLMSWDFGDATAIHDHGGIDWGCVQFFGAATHCTYVCENNVLEMKEQSTVTNGTIYPVGRELIHLMANTNPQSFCTLHIYGVNSVCGEKEPTIVFQPEKQQKVKTSGTAYLNMSQSEILSSQLMPEMSPQDYNTYSEIISQFYKRISEK